MTLNDFLLSLETLIAGDRDDAKIAAEDIAGDLLIWIEHVAWASADLDRRRTNVAGRLLALRNRRPKPRGTRLMLDLPPELIDLCDRDNTDPQTVLRGFIADLCGIQNWVSDPRDDGYSSNGSDERMLARAYYDRVGYSYHWNED